MMIRFLQPHPPGSVFAPGAFNSEIGRAITLRTDAGDTTATVVGYSVVDEGVLFDLEIPDELGPHVHPLYVIKEGKS